MLEFHYEQGCWTPCLKSYSLPTDQWSRYYYVLYWEMMWWDWSRELRINGRVWECAQYTAYLGKSLTAFSKILETKILDCVTNTVLHFRNSISRKVILIWTLMISRFHLNYHNTHVKVVLYCVLHAIKCSYWAAEVHSAKFPCLISV